MVVHAQFPSLQNQNRPAPVEVRHRSRRARAAAWWPFLVVLLLAVPALSPLWQPGLQQTDDGMHHLFRLFNLDLALRAGHPGARWLADEGFGYGFPVLNFYSPLGYYAGLLLHFAGAGFATTLELSLAAGLLLAALTMFLFARELLGPWGGAAAAIAYTWAPYHLADTWTRGALAESLAFVWFPLILLATWRVAKAGPGAQWAPALWGGVALAGLVLTHNLSLILVTPVLLAWTLFLLVLESRQRWATLAGLAGMALAGIVLSAIFWLPALAESSAIWAGQVAIDFQQWAPSLVPPSWLLSETWGQRYVVGPDIRTLHPLGQAQGAAALLGLVVGLWRWRRLPQTRRWALLLFLGMAVMALSLQSTLSRPVWESIPGLLLLQFPWRWQAVSALSLALITGYLGTALGSRSSANRTQPGDNPRPPGRQGQMRQATLLVGLGLVLASGALPGLPWLQSPYPTSDDLVSNDNVNRRTMALYDFGRGLWLREHGSAWMFEYMPVSVQVPRAEFFLPAGPGDYSQEHLDVTVVPLQQAPLEHRFRVSASDSWTFQLHQFYFPGWEALVDGAVQPARATGPLGLAGIGLPPGEHHVVLRFGSTGVRRAGGALSIAGLLCWVAAMAYVSRSTARRPSWLALVLAILLFVAAVAVRQRALPSSYTPVPVGANLGHQAQLVGFHAPVGQLHPGEDAEVILNWLALTRPETDYQVFVHLIDSNGRLWAQHDGQPGFFFSPTTRWQPGELLEDHHLLEWIAGESPPPGRYQLRAGLYDPLTGERLPVMSREGLPVDDQVLLAEFDLPGEVRAP